MRPAKSFPAMPAAVYVETSSQPGPVYLRLRHASAKRPTLPRRKSALPTTSLADIKSRVAELEAYSAQDRRRGCGFGGDRAALARLRAEAEEAFQMAEVRAGMVTATAASLPAGLLPQDDVPACATLHERTAGDWSSTSRQKRCGSDADPQSTRG
jgi:hypothetical protein